MLAEIVVYRDDDVDFQQVLSLAKGARLSVECRDLPTTLKHPFYCRTKKSKLRYAADKHHYELDGGAAVLVGHLSAMAFGCNDLSLLHWKIRMSGFWTFSTVWYGRVPTPDLVFPAYEHDVRQFWQAIRQCEIHGHWDHRASREGCPACLQEEEDAIS